MTNEEKIEKIRQWQSAQLAHPLTCGNDSSHQILSPGTKDGEVALFCLDCDYVQVHIPDVVLTFDKDKQDKLIEELKTAS